MKISYEWIKEYVKCPWSPRELAERLTLAGAEVEAVETVGDDTALQIEVTTNRPDWNGHLGIAREIGALTGERIQAPFVQRKPDTGAGISVTVQNTQLCPRYTAQLIRGVTVRESPAWLKRRLTTIGLRPVNNVVDVTNYIMFEANQPLHAFDAKKLQGPAIIVRNAVQGESIIAIDGGKCALTPDMLVIADAQRPVAVAGVMGGRDTEISGATTVVLLETAVFHPPSIRTTSKQLGIASDSSYRFERGVDIFAVAWVADRAALMIAELTGGQLVGPLVDCNAREFTRRRVRLTFSALRRLLGMEVGIETIERILYPLEFDILEAGREGVLVEAPSFRNDVQEEVDLIEEVIRVHGLHNLPTAVQFPVQVQPRQPVQQRVEQIHGALNGMGYYECVSDSYALNKMAPFLSLWNAAAALTARNPVREEQNLLRKSLLPSLLWLKKNNENFGNKDVRLYEIAHAYWPAGKQLAEPMLLGMLADTDYRGLKGVVESLLDSLHVQDLAWQPAPSAIFDTAAKITANNVLIGYLGIASRQAVKVVGLKSAPALCELNLSAFLGMLPGVNKFTEPNRMPVALRDLSITIDEAITWQAVVATVRNAGGTYLREVSLFDLYRGKPLPEGKKNFAFRLGYQAPDKTLVAEEVEALQQKIIAALAAQLRAELRK